MNPAPITSGGRYGPREPAQSEAELPLVTIVTPTLNMDHFLEEAIQSVLSQDYPKIEYIVVDGGSTDHSLEVLAKYAQRLQFWSSRDDGPADAINRGFRRAQGSILAYLNADDTYLSGAVSSAVRRLRENPQVAGVYGEAFWVNEQGTILRPYPTKEFQASLLQQECFICQPASFIRREAIESVGYLDSRLNYAYDYDLWIRLAKRYSLQKVNSFLATSRMHPGNKTLSARGLVFREAMELLNEHFGYVPFNWVYSYCCHQVDGRDQFFEPLQPSIAKYCMSLCVGTRRNWRRPLQFWNEWANVISFEGLKRGLQGRWSAVTNYWSTSAGD